MRQNNQHFQQNQQQQNQIYCDKHQKQIIRFICSKNQCEFGHLICDQCLQAEPIHPKTHKNYLFQVQDFLEIQTKMQQKFIPTLGDTFIDIERRFSMLSGYCEKEMKEVDKDFADLFKSFFTISEKSKTYLKDKIKGDQKQFCQKLKTVKEGFQNLAKQKNQKNFFQIIFNNSNEEIKSDNKIELIEKLIQRNAPLNDMRSQCIQLGQELDTIIDNRIVYRKNEQELNLFSSIKSDFEITCQDMYRRLKGLVDGGCQIEDLKRSIFQMNETIAPSSIHNNSLQHNLSQISLDQSFISQNNQDSQRNTERNRHDSVHKSPKTVTIDLSQSNISENLNKTVSNFSNFEQEMQKPVTNKKLKKLKQFPELKKEVIEIITKYGSLELKNEQSHFKNILIQGPFEFEDQSVYYGHMQNDVRHGIGKLLFKDGSFYEGYFKQNVPFGYGRIIRNNGDLYEGMCSNFKANGKGKFISYSGDYIYNGNWKDDEKEGQGEEIVKNQYQYKGQFKDNVFHGQGYIKFSDNSMYTGDFYEGQLTGQGEYQYANVEKYLGEILNGLKQGNGIYIWSDGRKYEGQFENDQFQGKGIYIWPDGFIFNGQWEKGEQNGKGIEINPNGQEKEGVWEHGKWVQWLTSQ